MNSYTDQPMNQEPSIGILASLTQRELEFDIQLKALEAENAQLKAQLKASERASSTQSRTSSPAKSVSKTPKKTRSPNKMTNKLHEPPEELTGLALEISQQKGPIEQLWGNRFTPSRPASKGRSSDAADSSSPIPAPRTQTSMALPRDLLASSGTPPHLHSPTPKKTTVKRGPKKSVTQDPVNKVTKSGKRATKAKSAQSSGANGEERPMEELLAANFFSLTQEEKARILLPLLQGKDPLTGEIYNEPGILGKAVQLQEANEAMGIEVGVALAGCATTNNNPNTNAIYNERLPTAQTELDSINFLNSVQTVPNGYVPTNNAYLNPNGYMAANSICLDPGYGITSSTCLDPPGHMAASNAGLGPASLDLPEVNYEIMKADQEVLFPTHQSMATGMESSFDSFDSFDNVGWTMPSLEELAQFNSDNFMNEFINFG